MASKRIILLIATVVCFTGCHTTQPAPIVYNYAPATNSEEAFERLKEGMTKKQFEQILGEPGITDVVGKGGNIPVRTTWKYPKYGVEVTCNVQGKLLTKSLTQTAYFPPRTKAPMEVVEAAKHSVTIELPESADQTGPDLQPTPDSDGWAPVTTKAGQSTQVNKPNDKTPELIEVPKNFAAPKALTAAKSMDDVGKRVHRGMNGKEVEAVLKLKPDVEIVVEGMGRERYYRSLECCICFDEYDELFKYYRVWASKMPSSSGLQDLFTLKPDNYEEATARLKHGMTLEQVTRRLGKPPSLNSNEKGLNTSWWPELDCILFFGPSGLENWSRATPANKPDK